MDNTVDAIEDGRIVSVSEDYAKREGLMILRKHEVQKQESVAIRQQMKISPRLRGDRKVYADLDKFRRPLRDSDEIKASLVDNFNWLLSSKRKSLNLNRKQVSSSTGVSEEDIKNLELGLLPHHDYVVISKLESYYGLNLRKNQNDIKMTPNREVRSSRFIESTKEQKGSNVSKSAEDILSSEIEIID